MKATSISERTSRRHLAARPIECSPESSSNAAEVGRGDVPHFIGAREIRLLFMQLHRLYRSRDYKTILVA